MTRRTRLILLLGFTLLQYSGCTKTVYVSKECPKIQTYDVSDIEDLQVTYEVYEEKKDD